MGPVRGVAQPGRCHGAGAERPLDPRQIVRPACSARKIFRRWSRSSRPGRRRRRWPSRCSRRSAAPPRAIPTAISRCRRSRRRRCSGATRRPGSACSRTRGARSSRSPRAVRAAERLAEKPLPVPPVPANLPPLPKGRIAEHEAKRILAEAGIPVLDERLVTNAGRGRPGRAADRRAAGAEDRVGRHPAQNRDGRRHARHPGGRGRRRVRPHDRAHQGARAARPARRRADLADGARRHRDDPRRAERSGVRPGRHARAGRHLRRGPARRDVPHRAVRGRGGAPHDRRIARPRDARRRARPAALRPRRAGRGAVEAVDLRRREDAPSSPASTSTRCWCARRARARRRSTR